MNRIKTNNAPQAIGTYSQGTKVGDFVFTSGQIAINPQTGALITNNFEEEVFQVLNNINAVLESGGSGKDSIIKLTVFLVDLSKFETVNNVFKNYFKDEYPSRSVVEVSALPLGVNIEVEAIGKLL
tara:strand:+ start:632 stop:1009 length:378 start_codon:yes stop_codon:yes gene_type:complete